jgi:hypothetical protein
VEDLIKAVTEEYEIDSKTATGDVFSFIENLSKYLIISE